MHSLAPHWFNASLYGLALCCVVALSFTHGPEGNSEVSSAAAPDGARILLEEDGSTLRIQGAFENDSSAWAEELAYELDVKRTGDAGTTRSTQSGTFETTPSRVDTLSTVQVNVQSGDRIEAHLTIERDETLVDEAHLQRHIE